jgi:plastocyanin
VKLLLLLAAAVVPHHETAREHEVAMGFNAFAPPRVVALTGDAVVWRNGSARAHTVVGDGFDSGRVGPGGRFERRFEDEGVVAFHCDLHLGMTGEVAVSRVLLEPPGAPAAPGRPYPVRGRAAVPPGSEVVVEGDGAPLGRATVGADGTWAATIVPRTSATLRATAGGAASPPATLLVQDRKVTTRRTGRSLAVTVTPAAPGQTVVLQLRLPLRFGWWPVQRAKLDAAGRARFRLPKRTVPHRVALTLADGATVLAASAPEAARHHH